MAMQVTDISSDVEAGVAMLQHLKGRTLYDAMRLLTSVVAAAFTDGLPLRDSPPEVTERLFGRLCAAGHKFRSEVALHPVKQDNE